MTKIVGIINISPDSFSGDGASGPNAVLARVERLLDEGADVIDIGAESTRPGATPLSDAGEHSRLAPILPRAAALCRKRGATLSLDSYRYSSVIFGLSCGIDYINDVSGGADSRIPRAVAAAPDRVKYIFMHNLGVPADKTLHMPEGECVIAELRRWRAEKLAQFTALGIEKERLVFDPGIGFGKTAAQSADIIANAAELSQGAGVATLIGHSRKSFLGDATRSNAEKDADTLKISLALRENGAADYVRVHNVARHRRAFR